tara:strand:+ start:2305 stop:2640 length:336 start_codon:yes stop_codon:yes gene_type:complete
MENINVNKILKESKDIYRQFLKNEASKELNQDKFLKNMRSKYIELNEKYPSIINISASQNYDEKRLKYMLNMAHKVSNNEISEKNASVKVGQLLVDEIVKPQLDKDKNKDM